MILGSHNTMSYLAPQWWMRPFAFMARCQDKDLQAQIDEGVTVFDLRITFSKKDGHIHFAHGLASYEALRVTDVLEFLDAQSLDGYNSNGVYFYVRIINERNHHKREFIDFCRKIERKYTHLKFFGGNNKKDWGMLYIFGDSEPNNFIDKYSSCNHDKCKVNGMYELKHVNCTGTILDDWWPRYYAHKNNAKWFNKYKNQDCCLMQDFVGVYTH